MVPQGDSLNTLIVFDRSLRLECETAGITVQDNGRRLMLLTARAQLTLTYRPDRISLSFQGSTLQGTSYIAFDSRGFALRNKNRCYLMDAQGAAKYLVARLTKSKMP